MRSPLQQRQPFLETNMTRQKAERILARIEQLLGPANVASPSTRPISPSLITAATIDTFTWVTGYAKTFNEHWSEEGREDPHEHFPSLEYLRNVFEAVELEGERVHWFEKSRDMMLSWSMVAYFTLQAMKVPFRG